MSLHNLTTYALMEVDNMEDKEKKALEFWIDQIIEAIDDEDEQTAKNMLHELRDMVMFKKDWAAPFVLYTTNT